MPCQYIQTERNILQNTFGGILVDFYAADFSTAQSLELKILKKLINLKI